MPAVGRLPPPFIGQGETATSMRHSVTYNGGVLAYNMPGVTVVLVNLCTQRGLMRSSNFRGRHGDSCTCRGIASWGSLTGVCAWSLPVQRSRVHPCFFDGLAAGKTSGLTGVGVAMSCQHRVLQ
jgi:hypothetical protein